MSDKRAKRKLTVLAVLISTVLVAGIALAAWTSSGTGSGTAQSGTSAISAISAGVSAADLYPGATKSVTIKIDNPNPYPVKVTSISGGTSALLAATESSALCAADTVYSDAVGPTASGITQTDGSTVNIVAWTGGSAAKPTGTYTIVTHMIAGATDGCKSRSFNLPSLTATLESAAS